MGEILILLRGSTNNYFVTTLEYHFIFLLSFSHEFTIKFSKGFMMWHSLQPGQLIDLEDYKTINKLYIAKYILF